MQVIETVKGDVGELHISGKLLFINGSDFRIHLNNILKNKINFLSIYLEDLYFMDSAGLGMLMIAQKECEGRNIFLSLHHPIGDVKILLQMTKSYERFHIVD